mgnify:FL=1|jgi:putative Holliday junction resolvase
MQPGRRLAVDVGKVRVGLAISDFHGILASGLTNVARQPSNEATCKLILDALGDEEIIEIYVGLPLSMSGENTASTQDAIELAVALSEMVATPIRMVDERLTTVSATAALRSSGKNSKQGRSIIDQVAATMILEQALNQERQTGFPAGREVSDVA